MHKSVVFSLRLFREGFVSGSGMARRLSAAALVMALCAAFAAPAGAAYIDPVNSPKITGLRGSGISQIIGLSNNRVGFLINAASANPSVKVVNTDGSQVYNTALGAALGSRASNKMSMTIYPIANGEIIVTVEGTSSGCDNNTGNPFAFLRLSATGEITTSLTAVSVGTAAYNCYTNMAELSNGNLAFAYQTAGDSYSLRILQPDGTAVTGQTSIEKTGTGDGSCASQSSYSAKIAANDNGKFLIAHHCYSNNNLYGVLYNNNGTQVTVGSDQHFSIGTHTGTPSQTVMGLTDNNFMVTFNNGSGFVFRKVQPDGTVSAAGSYSGGSGYPAFGVLGDGGFAAFDSNTSTADEGGTTYTYYTAFGVRYANSGSVLEAATNLDNNYTDRCYYDPDEESDVCDSWYDSNALGGTTATGYVKGILFPNGRTGDLFLHSFGSSAAAPTVTNVNPSSGPTSGGTSVAITGTNLTGASAVKFGGTDATGFSVDSSTQITATSPAGSAGTVDITVTTAGGTSATSSADHFTYVSSPTVTTQAVSAITATSATGNGNITATNGANATARGVIYWAYTNTDKVIGDAGVTNVSETGDFGTGAFTASLTSLSVNTQYNARAYATSPNGTGYGSRVAFWTLANVPSAPTVNNPTATTLDVAVNANGNPTGTEFCIQETSTGNYVQAGGTLGAGQVWQTAATWGTKTVTGLTTGATYTFQVKARNGGSTETGYGATASGIPVSAPTVTTQAASAIAATSATGNGNITATNGANATARGVIYWAYTNTDKVIGDAGVTNVSEAGDFGTGAFTASLTSLSVNTQYNARAYATSVNGTGYGSRVAFWTLANVPSAPTVNNPTSSTLDVAVNANGNPTTTEFCIQETGTGNYVQAGGTLGAGQVWQTAATWGTKTVTGLTTGTTYTFHVKARNGGSTETTYGLTASGIPVSAPTVTTQAVSAIAATSATGNGNITATNGNNATARGVIYWSYTDTDKVIGDGGVTAVSEAGDFGTGAFTASLTSLSVNVHYNARAYATSVNGTGYGSRVAFWTLANVPSAPTVNNPTSSTLDVAVNVNGNPSTTEFCIQETSTGNYVQAGGTLGAGQVWQTAATWGTKTVTGLTTGTTYTFHVKARNGGSTETGYGSTASGIPVSAPTVTTQAVSAIAATSATGNGNITATNGNNATVRGVIYWSYTDTDKVIGDGGVTAVSETGDFGTGAFTASLTSLSVNVHYNARAYATSVNGTGYGSRVAFWTLANVPSAPTLNNATTTSIDVTVNANGNPSTTEFCIQETSTGKYVQAGGALGAGQVWQTAATWGTKTVTGLTTGTTYAFHVKARNGESTETTYGATASQLTLYQYLLTVSINGSGTGSGTITANKTGVEGNGINCGADCSETYAQGTAVTLTPTPANGSVFAGWSGNADCADGQVTINGPMTCTALFNIAKTVTVPAATGKGPIEMATNSPGCGFYNVAVKTEPQVGDDAIYDYPYGLVEFRLTCATAEVTITFPGSITGLPYRKYGPTTPGNPATAKWYTYENVTVNGSNSITLHLKDGELGDDTAVDGIIVDQGGPAQIPQTPSVPTLTGWALLILTALLAIGALYCLRRRRPAR